eukprot:364902-Pyramimonas_sp.AAC.2
MFTPSSSKSNPLEVSEFRQSEHRIARKLTQSVAQEGIDRSSEAVFVNFARVLEGEVNVVDMTLDEQNSIWYGGSFKRRVTFGDSSSPHILESKGNLDAFICKVRSAVRSLCDVKNTQ